MASLDYLRRALELAERYDFVVASDECYSEIYLDEAQPAARPAAGRARGRPHGFERCIVFHSLSKRSSVPGLRSGFVAGDAQLIKPFLLYRTYHGCAMPLHDAAREHAGMGRRRARRSRTARCTAQKFAAVLPILREVMDVETPDASFYLWPQVADDERFTRELFERQHVTMLPGSYIARDTPRGNPGRGRVRISLVANVPECVEAARAHSRLRDARDARDDGRRKIGVHSRVLTVDRASLHDCRSPRHSSTAAFERRAELNPEERARRTFAMPSSRRSRCSTAARRASPRSATVSWQVNEWLKKAVLLSFRLNDNRPIDAGYTQLLRQGRRSSTPTTTKRGFAPTACASCRTRSCVAARTSRRTRC